MSGVFAELELRIIVGVAYYKGACAFGDAEREGKGCENRQTADHAGRCSR